MDNKIDSNVTSLAYAEEESLKVLPATPSWYGLEPNSYSDLGGEISKISRSTINASRQRQKGVTTDLDASGGFNSDITQNNLKRLMQGFLFADAREKFSTDPLNGTKIDISSVSTNTYNASSGLDGFIERQLILASNFEESENNGLAFVSTAASGSITVSKTLVAETTPANESKIETCGFQFPAGDLDIAATVSSISLISTATDFTTFGLNVGEWVFLGGEDTANKFANNEPGYARIKSIETNELKLDDTTFVATSETGTGLEIQLFFGTVIRNEKEQALIKRRTYNVERQLGQDDDGVQSEYLEGAVANEYTLNVPQADKLNADLTFMATDNTQRTGLEGVKSGNRISPEKEEIFNTSTDVYRLKLNVLNPAEVNPDALFGYVSEATIAINNGVEPSKAIGVLGAFDTTAGDFEVSGSIDAFFTTVEAVKAVRNNCDVGLNLITNTDNAATVYDLPLITLEGGGLNVEKDSPIKIPLDTNAAECEAGYTMLISYLPYVPVSSGNC